MFPKLPEVLYVFCDWSRKYNREALNILEKKHSELIPGYEDFKSLKHIYYYSNAFIRAYRDCRKLRDEGYILSDDNFFEGISFEDRKINESYYFYCKEKAEERHQSMILNDPVYKMWVQNYQSVKSRKKNIEKQIKTVEEIIQVRTHFAILYKQLTKNPIHGELEIYAQASDFGAVPRIKKWVKGSSRV